MPLAVAQIPVLVAQISVAVAQICVGSHFCACSDLWKHTCIAPRRHFVKMGKSSKRSHSASTLHRGISLLDKQQAEVKEEPSPSLAEKIQACMSTGSYICSASYMLNPEGSKEEARRTTAGS